MLAAWGRVHEDFSHPQSLLIGPDEEFSAKGLPLLEFDGLCLLSTNHPKVREHICNTNPSPNRRRCGSTGLSFATGKKVSQARCCRSGVRKEEPYMCRASSLSCFVGVS